MVELLLVVGGAWFEVEEDAVSRISIKLSVLPSSLSAIIEMLDCVIRRRTQGNIILLQNCKV